MSRTPQMDLKSSWSLWKINWADNLVTASVAAGMQSGAFLLFLYMFMQNLNRLLTVGGASLLFFWIFNVSASVLNAWLLSHPKFAKVADPQSP